MSNAWETTTDDILNVIHELGKKSDTDKVEEIYNELDLYIIEDAALQGNDIEEQTNYAYDEIKRQIVDNNLI